VIREGEGGSSTRRHRGGGTSIVDATRLPVCSYSMFATCATETPDEEAAEARAVVRRGRADDARNGADGLPRKCERRSTSPRGPPA